MGTMEMASFHKLRAAAQMNAEPADDSATLRVLRTLQDALVASGLFSEVELGRTADPDQMVIGVCRCTERFLPWEAGVGVERIWRGLGEALPWASHAIVHTDTLMEFEGAVTVDAGGRYVTVHLVAEPHAAPEPALQPLAHASSAVDA